MQSIREELSIRVKEIDSVISLLQSMENGQLERIHEVLINQNLMFLLQLGKTRCRRRKSHYADK